MFQVKFRGMNSYEAEQPIPHDHGELRAWKPLPEGTFECDETAAKFRYLQLVEEGIAGREVDGVIPHVVVIDELREYVLDGEKYLANMGTVLWTYADPDEQPRGPWAARAA